MEGAKGLRSRRGEHWFDPTCDEPPVEEIHETIREELDVPDPETFGF